MPNLLFRENNDIVFDLIARVLESEDLATKNKEFIEGWNMNYTTSYLATRFKVVQMKKRS